MSDFPYGATLTVSERLRRPTYGPVDLDRGRLRLARWSADEPFEDRELFGRRLDLDGLDHSKLTSLLGESVEEAPGERPAWLRRIETCYGGGSSSEKRIAAPPILQGTVEGSFWGFIEPLVRHATSELGARLGPLASAPSDGPVCSERITELVLGTLPFELLSWPVRTLVLEMNIARLQGELIHDDPRERFRQFAVLLADTQRALAILREVPVLTRQLVEAIDVWKDVVAELFERLVSDWPAILRTFSGFVAGDRLSGVRFGAGDRHDGGRSVALLVFTSGRRLVYKPRSLAMTEAFQEVLRTLAQEGFEPTLPEVAALDRGSYGYMQQLIAEPCATEEEVRRFYLRQGSYLALLYALRTTDIHFENLIAVGDTPYVIDLESLLQPGPPLDDPRADDLLRNTLVEVGLLPVRNWENEDSPGLDVSGMGGPEGQEPPRPEAYWADHETDTMHYARRTRTISLRSHHRPTVEGRPADAIHYVDAIVEGFSALYRHLLERRDDWLAEDGPIASMLEHEVRVLLRPTAVYGLMLRESFHPDLLRDALDRQRFFDKLWKQVARRPFLQRLIAAEQRALWQRDIPRFTTRPRSRALFTPDGEVLEDFFSQSAVEGLFERLQGFSEADLVRQIWYIRASIALLSTADPERDAVPVESRTHPRSATPGVSLENLAARIGSHLIEQALHDDSVRWVGVRPAPRGAFKIGYLDDSLYGGQAGVTLFLGCLGEVTGDPAARLLARQSCETLLRRVAAEDAEVSIGAFTGTVGLAYTLDQLAALWGDAALRRTALDLVARLGPRIAADNSFDVISGSAGVILALSAMRRGSDDLVLESLAKQAAQRLVAAAVDLPRGCGWYTTDEAEEPLAGFSHGAGGIAAALFEAAAITGDKTLRETARRALEYERSLFRPKSGNWRDLRVDEDVGDPVNWCHGAPGVIVSRALILRHEPSDVLREEIRIAARTTLAGGFGRNHSLCHGDLGNLESLVCADAACPELDLRDDIDRRYQDVAGQLSLGSWRCGLPMAIETPGLMVGLAGIGFGLLRRLAPDKVPAVLALRPISGILDPVDPAPMPVNAEI
ncbi:MAG: type 2 lantipeptide synthetase LanM family protein [Thermoanaerobaculia bacterium]|nr:type 2 lantipeptide synthetase LanM family protein [Thermoanaerobaculia bacterium]